MHIYDFITGVDLDRVKEIIRAAGYAVDDYSYSRRVDGDGWVVQGDVVMNINRLENAAKQLKIKVKIYSPPSTAAGGSSYSVTITMSSSTVTQLLSGGYFLYGFKAVETAQHGAPVVWFRTQNFITSTLVEWAEQYQAFTSADQIIGGGKIRASFAVDIELGQTLEVTEGGVGTVSDNGTTGSVSINNTTTTPYTCGISQQQAGVMAPLCAFPLPGLNMDVIVPKQRVLLMFATQAVETATVVERTYSTSILIDLTDENQRSVTYDFNDGWSWGSGTWAQTFPPNSDLVPLLTKGSSSRFGRSP